jgi:hypothetical protein
MRKSSKNKPTVKPLQPLNWGFFGVNLLLFANKGQIMNIKTHRVNKSGLEMIRQQLISRCKPSVFDGWLDDDLASSKRSQEMLGAWASDIESALDAGDGDFVEISSFDTKSGHVEHLEIDDSGIDVKFEQYE